MFYLREKTVALAFLACLVRTRLFQNLISLLTPSFFVIGENGVKGRRTGNISRSDSFKLDRLSGHGWTTGY